MEHRPAIKKASMSCYKPTYTASVATLDRSCSSDGENQLLWRKCEARLRFLNVCMMLCAQLLEESLPYKMSCVKEMS